MSIITYKRRDKEAYKDLKRPPVLNHLRTEVEKLKERNPGYSKWDFLKGALLKWVYHYIRSRFGRNHPYPAYSGKENGIYKIDNSVITLTADWATNTAESIAVADSIREQSPHYTIHMGDTYYVGEPDEIKANFLPEDNSIWHRGSKGSFALLGNHEMYARGIGFFRDLLPTMGLRDNNGVFIGQKAGFFCLENESWRILGLDTGYHSVGKVPIIEILPPFNPDCHFDKILMNWLKETVKLSDPADKRGIVILTHHQYISAFSHESEYMKPAKQIARLIGSDRPVIWFNGHEHKLAAYEKTRVKDGVTAYVRCIGHGGMPIELDGPTFKNSSKNAGTEKLVAVDKRIQNADNPSYRLGLNGYALFRLQGKGLEIEYRDSGSLLFSEKWVMNSDGLFSGSIDVPVTCKLDLVPGKKWSDAVK